MPSPPLSIVQSLSPRVAVLTSDDVADSCAANGCRGLDELLRPWEGGTERVSILSTTLTPTVHPSFPLRFVSYSSIYAQPAAAGPNPDVVIDLVGSCVGRHAPDEEQHYPVTRALLLSTRPLAPYETFNHPVGVLFAVSTSTPDPLGTLTRLYGQAVGNGAQAAPWMDGVQVLRFFVVVHDVAKMGGALDKANDLLAAVKKSYGNHVALLVINSRQDDPPLLSPDLTARATFTPQPRDAEDPSSLSQLYASTMASLALSPAAAAAAEQADKPRTRKHYAQKLAPEDVQSLIALVRELVVQSLVPWMEARVREWNEAYQSNRRGITGRLFGAGRKLFGSSRPSSPSPSGGPGFNAVKGYYAASTVEAVSRRLADFAFMLRDYRYASTVYDSLRRDFAQDRAWRYQAAATEMYGLSQLLSHNYFLPNTPPSTIATFTTMQHTEMASWLEQAVVSYQNRRDTVALLDALRITVLYYEAWKAINEWRGVGAALVRAAGEADEVPCAVIVEEAASADVKGGKSVRGRRRQAFHLMMAARRYEKAGLKQYSRRCLENAAGLMRNAPWGAVRDRIEYSLGRQAYTLNESDVAVLHFLRLLQKDENAAPGSQGMVLEDMALAYAQLEAHPERLAAAREKVGPRGISLPTPIFDTKRTRLVIAAESSSSSEIDWSALEQQALQTWDRKGKRPASLLPDSRTTVAAVGEALSVELTASNPLNAPVILTGLTLGIDGAADVGTIAELSLEPYETLTFAIPLTPTAAGDVSVKSAIFKFHEFLPVTESLERRGRRLHATKAQRLTPTYATDTSLTIHAESAAPRLSAELVGVPENVYCGEVTRATIRLSNIGTTDLNDIQLVCGQYGVLSLDTAVPATVPNTIGSNLPLPLYSGILEPGASIDVPITFTAPSPGRLDLTALAVFSTAERTSAAKLCRSFEVRRLLSLSTEIHTAREGYLVTLEAVNQSDSVVDIGNLSSVSEYWRATTPQAEWRLLPNQSVRSVFAVTAGEGRDLSQTALVSNLGRLLRGEEVGEETSPIEPATVDLDVDSSFLLSRRSYRLAQAAEDFPALPSERIPNVLPLFDPLDLDLVVPWHIADESRAGTAYAHGIRPSPAFSLVEALRAEQDGTSKRTMYEETGRIRRALAESVLEGVYAHEDDPLVVRATVPGAKRGRVVRDPSSSVLPVTLSLENRSPALSVRWMLRLPDRTGLTFTGSLSFRGTLHAGERTTVETAVWVAEPGIVTVGGWEVIKETGEEGAEGWTPRSAWIGIGRGVDVEVVDGQ